MNEAELKKQLAAWIDPKVLADTLVDQMAEEAEPEEMTLENAKTFYYDFLETELADALERSIRYTHRRGPSGPPPVLTKDYPRYPETPLEKWKKQAGISD